MQHQFQTNTKRDLKELITHTQAQLAIVKNQIPHYPPLDPPTHSSYHLPTKSWLDLKNSFNKFSKYSHYIADYNASLIQQLADSKNKLKKISVELKHYRNKTFQLQQQSLGYQKQLAEKDAQIGRLLQMLKIDASYISSTLMKNSDGSVSQEESSMISEDSLEDQSGLNGYESMSISNQLNGTDQQKKQGPSEDGNCVSKSEIHCISMDTQAEKMILDLMALLDDDASHIKQTSKDDDSLLDNKIPN